MIDPKLEITLIGFSHRTASVAVREQFAVKPIDLGAAHESLRALDKVHEAFVLSTCNRTEFLVTAEPDFDAAHEAAQHVFHNLGAEHLYAFRDIEAVIHLFRVASGLDSMILGEGEVLSQVKRSYEIASSANCLGDTLKPLIKHAIAVGKRVRTETTLGEGTLSVARVGVDVAKRAFGSFEERSATIVGAGETGILVARHLTELGIGKLTFVNRTQERGKAAAEQFGATALPLTELAAAIRKSDLVICAVDDAGHLVGPEHLDRKGLARRDRPLVMIDLSVPRAIDARVSETPSVLLYNLDDLGETVEKNLSGRREALERSDRLVVSEMHKYLALRIFKSFSPAIAALHKQFDEVQADVLASLAPGGASEEQSKVANELSRRLLDVALSQMKQGARYSQSEAALENDYQRYLENL